MAFGKLKPVSAVPVDFAPEDAEACALSPFETGPMLDLLPVPAVLVTLENGKFHFGALNRPFRMGGLGTVASESPLIRLLGTQLRHFLESDETQHEIAWQFGEEVDCRYFRVLFARHAAHRDTPRCLVTLVDQTSELRTEHSLRREMATDSLTGLPNRAGFSDQLEDLITTDNAESFAVLVVNLDRFSRVRAKIEPLFEDGGFVPIDRADRNISHARQRGRSRELLHH